MHLSSPTFETCSRSATLEREEDACLFPQDDWRVMVAEGTAKSVESEGARLGCDSRVREATHLSDLSDQNCGDWGVSKKLSGKEAYPHLCGPPSMQGWGGTSNGDAYSPPALIGVSMATCFLLMNSSDSSRTVLQEREEIIPSCSRIPVFPYSPSNVRASVTEDRYNVL